MGKRSPIMGANSGYSGWSMSKNAVLAYKSDEMPWSKWTKESFFKKLKKFNVLPEVVEILRQISFSFVRSQILEYSSWHHTSKFFNQTYFYAISSDVEDLTLENAKKLLADYKEYQKSVKELKAFQKAHPENKNNIYGSWKIEYIDWFEKLNIQIPEEFNNFAKCYKRHGLDYSMSGNSYLNGQKPTREQVGLGQIRDGLRRLVRTERNNMMTLILQEYENKEYKEIASVELYEIYPEQKADLSNEDILDKINGDYKGSEVLILEKKCIQEPSFKNYL